MSGIGPVARSVAGVLLAVTLAACATGPGPSVLSPASPVATPTERPAGDSAPPTARPSPSDDVATDARTAWGDITLTRLPVAVDADHSFVFSGAGTPDGRYLIGSILRNDLLDAPGTVPGDVVLYEVATATITRLAPMQTPTSQVTSAAADADWVVWMEASDPDAFDWRLFAARRPAIEVKEIARAVTNGGRAVQGPFTSVAVGNGTVVWGQARGTGISQGSVANAVVMRADLETGRVETVASGAGSPAMSWPWAAWEAFPSSGAPRVVFSNLQSGWTDSMDTVPATIVLAGTSAAYSAADLHSIWLVPDVTSGAAVEVARGADNGDYLQWPSLNDRIVAWSQDDSSTVYDRVLQRKVELPVETGWSSGSVAGPNLVWFETLTPGTRPTSVVIADTRTFGRP